MKFASTPTIAQSEEYSQYEFFQKLMQSEIDTKCEIEVQNNGLTAVYYDKRVVFTGSFFESAKLVLKRNNLTIKSAGDKTLTDFKDFIAQCRTQSVEVIKSLQQSMKHPSFNPKTLKL